VRAAGAAAAGRQPIIDEPAAARRLARRDRPDWAIGAIKSLEALSSICQHVGAIVLPGPVSIARVQRVFDAEGRCLDPQVEKRIRSVATNLLDYIRGAICPRMALEAIVRSV